MDDFPNRVAHADAPESKPQFNIVKSKKLGKSWGVFHVKSLRRCHVTNTRLSYSGRVSSTSLFTHINENIEMNIYFYICVCVCVCAVSSIFSFSNLNCYWNPPPVVDMSDSGAHSKKNIYIYQIYCPFSCFSFCDSFELIEDDRRRRWNHQIKWEGKEGNVKQINKYAYK